MLNRALDGVRIEAHSNNSLQLRGKTVFQRTEMEGTLAPMTWRGGKRRVGTSSGCWGDRDMPRRRGCKPDLSQGWQCTSPLHVSTRVTLSPRPCISFVIFFSNLYKMKVSSTHGCNAEFPGQSCVPPPCSKGVGLPCALRLQAAGMLTL